MPAICASTSPCEGDEAAPLSSSFLRRSVPEIAATVIASESWVQGRRLPGEPRNASLTSCPACSAVARTHALTAIAPCPVRHWRHEPPVVSDELGLQKLAAGSPVEGPAPPGAPLCAFAKEPPSASAAASAIVGASRPSPFRMIMNSQMGKPGSTAFQDDSVAKSTAFAKSLNPPAIGYHRVHCKAPLCERVRRPPGPHCIRSNGS